MRTSERLTPDQIERLRELWADQTVRIAEIAERFGRREDSIRKLATKLGLGRKARRFNVNQWPEERDQRLRELHAMHLSAGQIAKAMGGVTRCAVIGRAYRLGLGPIGGGKASKPSLPHRKPTTPRGGAGQLAAAKARAPAVRANPANKNTLGAKSMMAPTDLKDRVLLKNTVAPPEPVRFVEEEPGTATVLTLGAHMCKWPIGDPALDSFTFCGRRKSVGSYCADHAEVAYQPRDKKKDSASELARSLRRYI